ncbi:hypothetical protein IQ230_02610 [Gloeocapsopsis crepidinum LEGE 06123]|uniref:Uncharacterized protein n=1 Tax=Gloeocapsopsis crepidinum LEGE 06123 TaxID=588587 RepID=A0ABR9ULW8_9CHRO|nr:hypothetical protein [Gloeocapsopsis crepidinum]MBE9189277.1 hypothetical protein [Gloeocapsopsis crepidinum LEGE 06123]
MIGGLFQWRIEIVIGWLLLGLTVGLFISLGRNHNLHCRDAEMVMASSF